MAFSYIKNQLKKRGLVDRAVFTVASLASFAVSLMLYPRLLERNWVMVGIDASLAVMLFFVAKSVVSGKHIKVARVSLGVLLSLGMVGTSTFTEYSTGYWLYPGMIAIFFIFKPKIALSICVSICMIVAPFFYQAMPLINVFSLFAALIPTVVFIFYFAKDLRIQHENLRNQASEDFLTQSGNRRAFEENAEACIAQLNASDLNSVLILFDMDHFKRLNDTHGHGVGDAVLKHVSSVVKNCLRSSDRLYRLGGEEFGIILNNALLSDALAVTEKIRQSIKQSKFGSLPVYTVSFGLAILEEGDGVLDWMEKADRALYKSKQNGRDQVSVA